jgi:hypothetical protein
VSSITWILLLFVFVGFHAFEFHVSNIVIVQTSLLLGLRVSYCYKKSAGYQNYRFFVLLALDIWDYCSLYRAQEFVR